MPSQSTYEEVALNTQDDEMALVVRSQYRNTALWKEYIEDITRWQEQYLTSERRSLVRYCSCHEVIERYDTQT